MRIVADANVWISGMLWRGAPWRLLRLAEAGALEICLTPAILDEIVEVLAYPRLQPRLQELALTVAELRNYISGLAIFFESLLVGSTIVARDPDDDIYVISALVSESAYLVTADRHLLDIGEYQQIPIVTVSDFLAREFRGH